jgi:hypothetical protein
MDLAGNREHISNFSLLLRHLSKEGYNQNRAWMEKNNYDGPYPREQYVNRRLSQITILKRSRGNIMLYEDLFWPNSDYI